MQPRAQVELDAVAATELAPTEGFDSYEAALFDFEFLRPSVWPQLSIRRSFSLFLVVSMTSTVSSALYFVQSLLLILFVLTHLISSVMAIFTIVEISVVTQSRQPFDVSKTFRFNYSCSAVMKVVNVLKYSCFTSASIFAMLALILIIALLLCLEVKLEGTQAITAG